MKSLFGPQNRVALLDWSNVVWRALGVDSDPEEFLRLLLKMLSKYRKLFKSFDLVVALEGDGVDVRRRILPAYKAQRAHHEEVGELMELAGQVLSCLEAKVIRAKWGEADDAIASYVQQRIGPEDRAIVVSEDRDLWALVRDPSVEIHSTRLAAQLNEALVKHKLGVKPDKIRMLKALLGDSSDNLQRVRGLGTKTALRLVNDSKRLADVFALIQDASWVKKAERSSCISCKRQIRLNYKVCGLKKNLKLLEKDQQPRPKRLRELLAKHGVFDISQETIKTVTNRRS